MAKIKELIYSTKKQFELINITAEVNKFVADSRVLEGACFVFSLHATASLYLNENEPGVKEDILQGILSLAPESKDYKHNVIDGNARAHILAAIVGSHLTLPVIGGKLALGTWQEIFFVELDGPRPARKVIIKIIEG
ncbi:MAG: secondary thiamine-phosphate synthase enzyme YjbQ [Patescibacteria group bacterium]